LKKIEILNLHSNKRQTRGSKMSEKKKFRLDMVITDVEAVDEKKGLFRFKAVPDPRVWERRTINGEHGYWHKIDKVFLTDEELKRAAPTLKGKPMDVENVGVKNKEEYLRRSKNRIEGKSEF
jgi:hypothetical protein